MRAWFALNTSPGADVQLIPQYLPVSDADRVLSLLDTLPGWRQDYIRVYGKTHPLPRLHRWFADSRQPYRWSGIDMHPEPFPEQFGPSWDDWSKTVGSISTRRSGTSTAMVVTRSAGTRTMSQIWGRILSSPA